MNGFKGIPKSKVDYECKHQTAEKLSSDVKGIVRDSEQLLHDSKGAVDHKVPDLQQRLTGMLEAAKDTYQKLEAKTKASAKASDKAIRSHPYQAASIAGLGLIVGFIAGRWSAPYTI